VLASKNDFYQLFRPKKSTFFNKPKDADGDISKYIFEGLLFSVGNNKGEGQTIKITEVFCNFDIFENISTFSNTDYSQNFVMQGSHRFFQDRFNLQVFSKQPQVFFQNLSI